MSPPPGIPVHARFRQGSWSRAIRATEVKGLIIGCQAMQTYDSESAERLVDVVLDGLRAPSGT
jgi:hypothetical protein